MSQTMNRAGHLIFFPPWLETDDRGVIRSVPPSHLSELADDVATDRLFPFIRSLINSTARRRNEGRWSAVNRQRLEVAKLCIDRALAKAIKAETS